MKNSGLQHTCEIYHQSHANSDILNYDGTDSNSFNEQYTMK